MAGSLFAVPVRSSNPLTLRDRVLPSFPDLTAARILSNIGGMQVDLKENLQQNLAAVCESVISQRSLGEVSGVHYTYINAIIHGRSSPTFDIVAKLVVGLKKAGLRGITQEKIVSAPKDFKRWLDDAMAAAA